MQHIKELLLFIVLPIVLLILMSNSQASMIDHMVTNYKVPKNTAVEINTSVTNNAKAYGVDKYILFAIIEKESSYQPKARNRSSIGLMQVNIAAHEKKFGSVQQLYNINNNIKAGAMILAACKKSSKDSLSCYHGAKNGYSKRITMTANKLKKMEKKKNGNS